MTIGVETVPMSLTYLGIPTYISDISGRLTLKMKLTSRWAVALSIGGRFCGFSQKLCIRLKSGNSLVLHDVNPAVNSGACPL